MGADGQQQAEGTFAKAPVDMPTSEESAAFGFLPDVPYYEILGDVGFDIGLVQRSLFASTYRDPVVLPLRITDIIDGEEFFSLVLSSVQQAYASMEHDHRGIAVGCFNHPDWIVRGHLIKSPHDPYPEFMWVIARLIMDGDDRQTIDRIQVQLVRDGKDGPRPW